MMLIMITVWVKNRLSFDHQFSAEDTSIQTSFDYKNGSDKCSYLPLEILQQPLDQTDCYGNEVEFSVIISGGTGIVKYQWQIKSPNADFADISGAEQPSLSIEKIGVNDENIDRSEYRVLISDDLGTIVSNPAILHINSITDILPDDVNSAICSGAGISYSLTTYGNALSYQWSFKNTTDWINLSDDGIYTGTTTTQLFVSDATTAQSGSYRVSVKFKTLNQSAGYPTCIITSDRKRNLIVKAPLSAPVVSQNQNICLNTAPAALALTEATGGFGPYLYQWKNSSDGLDWTNIDNAIDLNYFPSLLTTTIYYMLEAKDGGTLSCGGPVNSEIIKIAVNPYPDSNPINPD